MKSFKGIQAAPSGGAMMNQHTEPEGCWRRGRGTSVAGAEKTSALSLRQELYLLEGAWVVWLKICMTVNDDEQNVRKDQIIVLYTTAMLG